MTIAKAGRGAAFADFDNDGDVDVFVNNVHDTPDLYRLDVSAAAELVDGAARGRASRIAAPSARACGPTAGGVTQVRKCAAAAATTRRTICGRTSASARAHGRSARGALAERPRGNVDRRRRQPHRDAERGQRPTDRSPEAAMVIAGRAAACRVGPGPRPHGASPRRGADQRRRAAKAVAKLRGAAARSPTRHARRRSRTCWASPTITPTIRPRRSRCSRRRRSSAAGLGRAPRGGAGARSGVVRARAGSPRRSRGSRRHGAGRRTTWSWPTRSGRPTSRRSGRTTRGA